MIAVARVEPGRPRLVLDAQSLPGVRVRVWDAARAVSARAHAGAHPGVELAWIDEGALAYEIGGASFEVERGDAMLVPREVEHVTTFLTPMRAAAIWIDPAVVAEIGDAVGRARQPAIGVVPNAARIAALGAMLTDEMRRGDRGALLAADALVEAMIVTALRAPEAAANDEGEGASGASPRDPAILRAIRFVESQYAEPIGVDEIARAAHMSRFHFSRRFREATGRSPYQYLQGVRLARAAALLRRGRAGVTEVAFAVGFNDPSRFARAFRTRFGASPASYSRDRRARVATSFAAR